MVLEKHISSDSTLIKQVVTSAVPGAEQITDVGAELSFILPATSTSNFPALFQKLNGSLNIVMIIYTMAFNV